ncbi:PssD/Cps14F family polysaccharide biosynthesis glycosyltransferase [Dehalobacter sp. UNSWDHB]|uniref:PssD/Cps14F family polysaccharide biosynthesis glycosyltransferase n=1 Tax=Dehalobacter sp. UNSWDHB TaxID=1339256 RepID=UPI000551ACEC|nr:PssD/Cps14F family polysaccharide biosynthesis glycosyltransferase [Dehalobacter sp. UNSWDHB]
MDKKKTILFAASSGGHLEQILCLRGLNQYYNTILVTEKTGYDINTWQDTVYWVPQVNRREFLAILKLLTICFKSIYIFFKEKPDIVITTGALSVVPTCLIAKVFRKKFIYIESFAKVETLTLTGKLMYNFAGLFIVQWEELHKLYTRTVFGGSIY